MISLINAISLVTPLQRADKGDRVRVRDGVFSAFYLSKVDALRSVKVKRVK